MQRLEVNPYQYDSRMMEWNLKNNKLTKEELKKYLESLPDDAHNSEKLSIEEE